MNTPLSSDYRYDTAESACSDRYLWPAVETILSGELAPGSRLFDLGCGNGSLARRLGDLGYDVFGVDPSREGIAFARNADAGSKLEVGSAYEPLAERFGTFPAVVSLEVIEHVYYPRQFAACLDTLLEPGGLAVVSTPYHGYMKNLALALTGKFDAHFTALWDHGHIKFWSVATLTDLFSEQGLARESVHRVGRVPTLAKSMVLTFRKPVI
jgi:2-polyprenyl-6-hydroxyphenyl methylase/3-demethylubiquinone-9 3-methyltransferase